MRLLLALIFAGMLTASTIGESFDLRVWRFQAHWDRFIRQLWGCSPADVNRNTCNQALGNLDRKEYEAARKAAAELFEFAKDQTK